MFAKWNAEGELVRSLLLLDFHHRTDCSSWQRGTFLIDIGAQINKQRDDKGKHVLSVVEDKVVQDIDGTEGTGVSSRPLVEPFLDLAKRIGLVLGRGHQIACAGPNSLRCTLCPRSICFSKRPKEDQGYLWRPLSIDKVDRI